MGRASNNSYGYVLLTGTGYTPFANAIIFGNNGSTRLVIDSNYNTHPGVDNVYDCGIAGYRWNDIYASNATIQTSDLREKENIQESDLGLDFIKQLKPVSYKWKDRKRTHYGLIAQDVKQTLNGKDFAGFIYNQETDRYGLRYTEFIPILIKAIQEQQKEIEFLKTKIN